MRVESFRDEGQVLCAARPAWVDLECCYRCAACRSIGADRVVCELEREPLYSPARIGLPGSLFPGPGA